MHVACYHHHCTPHNGDATWTRPYPGGSTHGPPSPPGTVGWPKNGPGGPDQSIATIVILPDEVPWRAKRGRFQSDAM